ncbi:MAG TPA: PAS domain S-box protein [Methanoregulaceae archaeon]|nr:PAS domain S-box protein [Methanoregulaceae archaeon]
MTSVLLVDDEPALLDVARLFLERKADFQVHTAISAQSALEKLKLRSYDVIISDYEMPEMNGIEFLKIVRQEWKDLPFIIFTGKGREEVVIEALNAGADFYLQKGGNPRTQFVELRNMVLQAVKRHRAELDLIRSEKRLNDIINHLPYATFAIDRSGVVIAWNRTIEELTGVKAEDMIGKGNNEYAIPFYGYKRPLLIDLIFRPEEEIDELYQNISKYENTLTAETPLPKPRGKDAILWGKASPLYDENGQLTGSIESIVDISGQRRTEKALTASEQKYYQVLDQAQLAILVAQDGLTKYLNPYGLDAFGFSLEQIIDRPFIDLIHPEDRQIVMENYQKRLSSSPSPEKYSFRIIDRCGKVRLVEINVIVIQWDGRPATLNFVFDITERSRTEDALKKSEGRLNLAIEGINLGVWETDYRTSTHQFNAQAAKILGFEPVELYHSTDQWVALVHPDDLPRLINLIESHQKELTTYYEAEYRIRHKEGHYIWVRVLGKTTEYDDAGTPVIATGIMLDITEQKHNEAALVDSNRKYRSLLRTSPDAIIISDPSGKIRMANARAARLQGFDRTDEMNGLNILDFSLNEDLSRFMDFLSHLSQDNVSREEFIFQRKDGSTYPAEISASIVTDRDEKSYAVQAIVRDVTERRKAEEALRANERRFKELAEMLPLPIFESNLAGDILYANRQALLTFGYENEIVLRGISIFEVIVPSDRQRMREHIGEIIRGSNLEVTDYTGVRRDGSRFQIRGYTTAILDMGQPVGIRGFVIDSNEMQKAENALKNANAKLNLMNTITRHDILNQLMVIHGYLDLSRELSDNRQILEMIHNIGHAAESIGRQIEFTKDYQDVGTQAPRWHSLVKVVESARSMLTPGIDINCRISNLEIYADPLIEKVFYNILDNAVRYGGNIPRFSCFTEQAAGGIILVCENDGKGIPVADKERIFERGFGKNTGYGLFLAREILSITGLTIHETGVPGKKARFEIFIPDGDFRYLS